MHFVPLSSSILRFFWSLVWPRRLSLVWLAKASYQEHINSNEHNNNNNIYVYIAQLQQQQQQQEDEPSCKRWSCQKNKIVLFSFYYIFWQRWERDKERDTEWKRETHIHTYIHCCCCEFCCCCSSFFNKHTHTQWQRPLTMVKTGKERGASSGGGWDG